MLRSENRRRITKAVVSQRPPKSGRIEVLDTVVPQLALRISSTGARSFAVRTRLHGKLRRFTIGDATVFKLDEDTDCWRRRIFENIQVNKGDDITLVGKADQKEQAKLDYVEFIPHRSQHQ